MTTIDETTPDDYEAIVSLLSRVFPIITPERWASKLDYWWESNPAFGEDMDRGWILKDNDEVVGFTGNIPTKFQIAGREIIADNCTAWGVLPEYRSKSIFLIMKQIKESGNSVLFSSTPAQTTLELIQRCGFQILPGYDNQNLSTVLLPYRQESKEDHLLVREIPEADRSFDDLWEGTKDMFSNTNIRTSEVINWYLAGGRHKKLLLGCYEGNSLLGYALFELRISQENKGMRCIDLWCRDNKDDITIRSLVNHSIMYCRENEIQRVDFPHFSTQLDAHFSRMNMQRSRSGSRFYYRIGSNITGAFNAEDSYFVDLQGDFCLG